MTAKPSQMTPRSVLSGLELNVYDAVDASRLLEYLVNDMFGLAPEHDSGYYMIGRYEADVLNFASRIVGNHARDLKTQWDALHERTAKEACEAAQPARMTGGQRT